MIDPHKPDSTNTLASDQCPVYGHRFADPTIPPGATVSRAGRLSPGLAPCGIAENVARRTHQYPGCVTCSMTFCVN